MLERSGDLRSRLPVHVVPLPIIYTGQHWHPVSRSRWDTVMSSRFSVRIGSGQAAAPDWRASPARNSRYELWVCLSSLELF